MLLPTERQSAVIFFWPLSLLLFWCLSALIQSFMAVDRLMVISCYRWCLPKHAKATIEAMRFSVYSLFVFRAAKLNSDFYQRKRYILKRHQCKYLPVLSNVIKKHLNANEMRMDSGGGAQVSRFSSKETFFICFRRLCPLPVFGAEIENEIGHLHK